MTEIGALPPRLARRVAAARRAVVLTGAGVSEESGLGTFRGPGGLWEEFRPEELATPQAFARHPRRVWDWYAARHRTMAAAAPNAAHRALARWPALFPSFLLVTQNIDQLHQRAGSPEVIELHGTLMAARCASCGARRPMAELIAPAGPSEPTGGESPPRCGCGGLWRPDVVWFGEELPMEAIARAQRAAASCDLFVSAGTSATVFPAAGLIALAHQAGAVIVEVNPEATAFSALADLRLPGAAGTHLPALTAAIEACRSPG
jgi:NAD-dependent deacetylase